VIVAKQWVEDRESPDASLAHGDAESTALLELRMARALL
jgi:hypothetical protein